MEAIKKYKIQVFFHLMLNLAIGGIISFASFIHYPLFSFTDHLFYIAHFLILQFTVFGFLYLLSLSRILFVSFFPVFFFLFSIIAYWVYMNDIAISHHMVQIVSETKPDIVIDLLSVPFLLYMVISIIIIVIIIKSYSKIEINQLKSPLLILAILAIITYFIMENYKYGTFTRRLPYNAIVAVQEHITSNKLVIQSIKQPLKTNIDSLSVIFILGESVRADHLQLNGYHRMTNPLLSKRKNIISFPNTYTPFTYTGKSVQQILSDAAFTDDLSRPKYSLIEALNRANIATNWIGNQTPEKSYEMFINQTDYAKIIDPMHSELSFQKEHDGRLVPVLKSVFKPYKNQFTVVHMMGSHWWFESRYPAAFRVYKPVIKSKHIPSNSKQEMINSYDNSILYLDYFIDNIITHVEIFNSNTLIVYLSDHGELLGENGLWLHAQESKPVSNPAMIVWYSDTFKKKNFELVNYLEANNTKQINLDFFFPSMMKLFEVEGIEYDERKSWD